MKVRKALERGYADHGWLKSYHSFSFADYYSPEHMGFRALRVINEDRVAPGRGFGTHGHRDMEIISYVLEGALRHQDSLGTGSVIRPGDVQRMTAGTGVRHSEFNPSDTEEVHFLQIWLLPETQGLQPSYEQRTFTEQEKLGTLRLVASKDGRELSLTIHADASLYAGVLEVGQEVVHPLAKGRHAWVQVVRGAAQVNGTELQAGDGAALSDIAELALRPTSRSEILVFDLA